MKILINAWKNSSIEEKILWLYLIFMPFTGNSCFYLAAKRIGYVDFIFLVLFSVCLVKYLNKKIRFQNTSLEFPFIFMLALFSVSFINSQNLFDSLAEISGLVYLVIFFILIANIISDSQRLRYFLKVYLFISTGVALAGLFYMGLALVKPDMVNSQFLQYTAMESMAHHFPRIKLAFETPNMMLSYLHSAFIIGMILFLSVGKVKIRPLILLAIVIILIAAFFTGSRRFTGLLLSLFIILCWFGRGRIISLVKYLSFFGFILFFVISVITSIWVVFPVKIEKDVNTIALKANDAYSLHFIQPVASINMFKKHPIIGVGYGAYNKNFKDNVDWKWLRYSFGYEAYPQYVKAVENKTLNFDPHSVFLGSLAETGLVGFFGLMYFFLAYMMLLVGRFRKSEKYSLQNIISGCILAGFIGFLLNGITLDILSMRHFWIMMAIGITRERNKYDLL